MHKTILSLAGLVAASSLLIFALADYREAGVAQAHPAGPVVTGGAHPWQDFSGTVAGNAFVDLYTVPADRVFVVTGMCTSNSTLDLRELVSSITNLKLEGGTTAALCAGTNTGGYLAQGRGHVTFAAGTTVRLQNTYSNQVDYTLEGYLAAP